MMCDFVAYNHFDFEKRMKEIRAVNQTEIR